MIPDPQLAGGNPLGFGGPSGFAPGMRATSSASSPVQTMANPAPWLKQSTMPLAPMKSNRPQLGSGQPQLGSGQAGILEQQQALADQMRAAPVKDFDEWKNPFGTFGELPPYKPPPETDLPGSKLQVGGYGPDEVPQYASSGGHMDYSGEVPTFVQDPWSPGYEYMFGPDYSDYYNKAHGAGSYDAEATRYAGLDKSNQLGDYESQYGEFPESDAAAMEEWFRRAGTGGAITAQRQDMIAQNKRTDMTEAGIMTALTLGMGAITGPASAAMMAGAAEEAAALGAAGMYGGAAGGGFTLGSLMPTTSGLANTAIRGAYEASGP